MAEVEEVKKISIKDFLENRGVRFIREGHNFICRSPISSDRTPSFYYYPHTNTFYDWANGVGGDIVRLVQEIDGLSFKEAMDRLTEGSFETIKEYVAPPKKEEFILDRYLNNNEDERKLIDKYALYRGITLGYVHSKFYISTEEGLFKRFGLGFIHTDEEGKCVGIKIRDIEPFNGRRFTIRGEQKFYCLENNFDGEKILYIVESETSANSLHMFLMKMNIPSIVVSIGSWNNIPEEVPIKYRDIVKRKVVIDYDGNEELYEKRIEKFKHLEADNVKLELPKGHDINYLYTSGKLIYYKNKLL